MIVGVGCASIGGEGPLDFVPDLLGNLETKEGGPWVWAGCAISDWTLLRVDVHGSRTGASTLRPRGRRWASASLPLQSGVGSFWAPSHVHFLVFEGGITCYCTFSSWPGLVHKGVRLSSQCPTPFSHLPFSFFPFSLSSFFTYNAHQT